MNIVQIIFLAILGSLIGYYLQIPIGVLVGSFVFVLIAQLAWLHMNPLPKKVRFYAQVLIGGVAGLNINRDILVQFKDLIIPSILSVILHILFSIGMAYILIKFLRTDRVTAITSIIPAGMSEIIFIAKELETDVQLVIITHLYRVMMIITLIPLLMKFLL
ncbi:AbrB family transcriptional regulator [Salirhabdus salicampi]|uniref:AbrB family transcriptional regulator n=1 Tax=Salirhabdus salicampi TaxID=476102 RepID=UPI0020C4F9F9|nr:AbrB family transcriptional regulator [Salirhabdus salicampi]MCP8615923.1 AbrB family transcriptional regulator [Salirhabdus salicampi]